MIALTHSVQKLHVSEDGFYTLGKLGIYMHIRNEIERIIKGNNINRSNCFECSKISYKSIIKKFERKFVLNGGNIHYKNTTH